MILTEIKPHNVNGFYVAMTKNGVRQDGKPGGYSKGTIAKTANVLSSILKDILTHYNAGKAESDKLPMIPFHGLRPTTATLQIAAGTDVRTVSSIMGHRETSTTMNIYAHNLKTAEQEAVKRVEEMIAKQA